jgi:hypothetical protein
MSSMSNTSTSSRKRLQGLEALVVRGLDELVDPLLSRQERHALLRMTRQDLIRDGVQEMRFAKPRRAKDKQRRVASARPLGDVHGRRVRHARAGTDDEALERVARIEASTRRGGTAAGRTHRHDRAVALCRSPSSVGWSLG